MFRRRLCCCDICESCEDSGRSIAYVDKDATGAGDGSSWADAYTTIGAAVSAVGSTHRIYIKGYGKSVPYSGTSGTLSLGDDVMLIASDTGDEVWADYPMTYGDDACIVEINLILTSISGYIPTGDNNTLVNCRVEGATSAGFGAENGDLLCGCVADSCGTGFDVQDDAELESCSAIDCTFEGFSVVDVGVMSFSKCIASGCRNGFRIRNSIGTLDQCVSSDNSQNGFQSHRSGGYVGIDETFTSCVADGNGLSGWGIFTSSPAWSGTRSLTGCDATNNAICGYHKCTLVSGNTASGNGGSCAGVTYCDGSTDPCGICDECP